MDDAANTKTIGRFTLTRTLGKGAQSVVYLAYDPHLQREVAIKTLQVDDQVKRAEKIQALLQEARTVSKLRHPSIVPIFEAGEHDGNPYLVFEYVEGGTLAQHLKEKGALPANRAVEILSQALDAVSHAHQHQIIHRDLKPSNILLNHDGLPRVMDFGIAAKIGGETAESGDLIGTPAYLSPEYISQGTVSIKQDIFAAGLILFEMLTGRRAVQGDTVPEMLRRIVAGSIYTPGMATDLIDEKLGDIILKALAKDPLNRYDSAEEMKEALDAYLQPGEEAPLSEEAKQSTLDFLLRRMRHKSDFPALSESVSAINKIVSAEQESMNKLSNIILRDVALTNKLLKLVNSAYFSRYGGGTISTVSRAIIILGFEAVRNIAITLMLFEHLQNKSHAVHLKEEFLKSLLTATLAKDIASRGMMKDSEEAFICAMFHNLGRMLSMFYFPEESEEIKKVMTQKECSDDIASAQVLGISYQDLGMGIARSWGFPDQIIYSMRKPGDGPVKKPTTGREGLRIVSGFSSALCEVIANSPQEERGKEIKKLMARYGEAAPISEKRLQEALSKAIEEVSKYASVMRINLQESAFGKQLGKAAGQAIPGEAETLAGTTGGTGITAEATQILDATMVLADQKRHEVSGDTDGAKPIQDDPQGILTDGIQDISNSLVDGCSLNDILRMILETMYRSMGFQRVLLCIKDGKQNVMTGRFGFGPDVPQLVKSFKFPLTYAPDVFHAAVSNNVDILISDINDPKIKDRIPDWYRKTITAQTFVIFPLNIKNVPVALIYADKETAGEIVIPEKELSLLRTLRNQAVLAIKQSF